MKKKIPYTKLTEKSGDNIMYNQVPDILQIHPGKSFKDRKTTQKQKQHGGMGKNTNLIREPLQ